MKRSDRTPAATSPVASVGRRPRDPVTALFAAALDGDTRAEDELRELAHRDNRSADALAAIAYAAGLETRRFQPAPCVADIAAADQTLAACLSRIIDLKKCPRA